MLLNYQEYPTDPLDTELPFIRRHEDLAEEILFEN